MSLAKTGDGQPEGARIPGAASPKHGAGQEFVLVTLGFPAMTLLGLDGSFADGLSEAALDGAGRGVSLFQADFSLSQQAIARSLVCCNSAGFTVVHLFQDFVDPFGPDKRFGVLVVGLDVMLNGFNQFLHAFECAAANPFPGDFTKPPLDQV